MIRADSIYPVQVTCPSCGELDTIKLMLKSRLEQTKDTALLGVQAKSAKIDHFCGQTSIDISDRELGPE